jgi:uncharacterized UBP type Zn finger protein
MTSQCTHVRDVGNVTHVANGRCFDRPQTGDTWVHLRICMTCGYVGCFDSSPNRHASRHAVTSEHPVAQSFEPTEDWYWCYIDQVAFVIPGSPELSYV